MVPSCLFWDSRLPYTVPTPEKGTLTGTWFLGYQASLDWDVLKGQLRATVDTWHPKCCISQIEDLPKAPSSLEQAACLASFVLAHDTAAELNSNQDSRYDDHE